MNFVIYGCSKIHRTIFMFPRRKTIKFFIFSAIVTIGEFLCSQLWCAMEITPITKTNNSFQPITKELVNDLEIGQNLSEQKVRETDSWCHHFQQIEINPDIFVLSVDHESIQAVQFFNITIKLEFIYTYVLNVKSKKNYRQVHFIHNFCFSIDFEIQG